MKYVLFVILILITSQLATASNIVKPGTIDLNKIGPTIFNTFTTVVPAAGDLIPIADTSDSGKNKNVLVSSIKNAVYRSVTTTDAVGADDETMKLSSATFTSTLPTAVGVAGKKYKYVFGGTNDYSQVYTLATTSGQTIGGYASGVIQITPGETMTVESDGANWMITSHHIYSDWISLGTYANFYTFTVVAGSYSGTLVATYTNNGATCTLAKTFTTGDTSIIMSCTGAVLATGTLTNTGGTHVGNPIYTAVSGSANDILATTTAPTYYGSPTNNSIKVKRVGSMARYMITYYQSIAGAVAGAGDFKFPIKIPNATFDSTVIAYYSGGTAQTALEYVPSTTVNMYSSFVSGEFQNNGVNAQILKNVVPFDSTHYRMYGNIAGGSGLIAFGANMPANVVWGGEVQFELPITGWVP